MRKEAEGREGMSNSIDRRLERLKISGAMEKKRDEYLAFYRQQMRAIRKLVKLAEKDNEYAVAVIEHMKWR